MENKGFTLLEVIIALAIMVVSFSSILAVEGDSINASTRSKQMNIVSMLARNQMVEQEFKIEGKLFNEVPKEESGVFASPYEDYKWKATVKEIEFPKLNVGKALGDSGNNQTVDLVSRLFTRFLSKALREVTVTVTWKKGAKEQNLSLSTYWVDLAYEFSISE